MAMCEPDITDEQMEELRQDLDESKAAYRDQVETLLKRLEALQPPE